MIVKVPEVNNLDLEYFITNAYFDFGTKVLGSTEVSNLSNFTAKRAEKPLPVSIQNEAPMINKIRSIDIQENEKTPDIT